MPTHTRTTSQIFLVLLFFAAISTRHGQIGVQTSSQSHPRSFVGSAMSTGQIFDFGSDTTALPVIPFLRLLVPRESHTSRAILAMFGPP